MLDAGCRMLDTGCRMPDTGCRVLDAGYGKRLEKNILLIASPFQ